MLTIWVTVLFLGIVHSDYSGDSCLDGNKPGVCIAQSECQSLLDEVKTVGSPMPRSMRRRLHMLRCGWNIMEPLVCCVPKEILTTKAQYNIENKLGNNSTIKLGNNNTNKLGNNSTIKLRNNSTNKLGNNNTNKLGNNSIVTGPPDVQGHRNLDLLPRECGDSQTDKIWNGNKTALFEMPWMVLLSYSGARTKYNCGGTLINEWYVLTAAHCVEFLGRTQKLESVLLGEYDLTTNPDCGMIQGVWTCAPNVTVAEIAQIIPHPGYNPTTNQDDIALIRLAKPANFTLESMKPICLPVTRNLQNEVMEGLKDTVVAGWGVTETGLQSSVLLSVDLPVMKNKDCADYFAGKLELSEKQLCAGGLADKDSCGGDSGGPLMYPGDVDSRGARYVQRGIVSLGSKRCAVKGFPSVFTRTAYYMDWILDNIHG